MQHFKWGKTGRVFSHADESKPNQFTWKSSIGQQNVDLGGGSFAPYVWNKADRSVKFGECELRLTSFGLEFWHKEERLNTLSFNPEYKQGANFKRRIPTVGSLSIQEIDPGNSKAELKISYKITTPDSETEIFVRAGYNHKVHFGTCFKALRDGVEQRVSLEFSEKLDPVQEYDRNNNPLPTVRYKTAKSWWAWDRKEHADHEVEQTTITKIHLGKKIYALDEEKIISPDTWGTDVGIAANEDDGEESGGVWRTSGIYDNAEIEVGYVSSAHHGGWRWDNITIPQGSTINSGILDIYVRALNSSGTPNSIFYAWDTDDAAQFAGANRPSTVDKTNANVAWNPTAWPQWYNITVTDIIQEIVNRALWASGNAINFLALSKSTSYETASCEDYNSNGTDEAELTITYTAGGGGLSIVDDSRGMLRGEMRGMNRGMSRIN